MPAFIATALVGIVCIVLGVSNCKGNISSLHSYHRQSVSEEDRIPFGKKVGLGTIIIGVAGGRVGIVLPDNVLTDGGATAKVREKLLKEFNLHRQI